MIWLILVSLWIVLKPRRWLCHVGKAAACAPSHLASALEDDMITALVVINFIAFGLLCLAAFIPIKPEGSIKRRPF